MILFENVTKRFGENPPTLVDVSFSMKPGEFAFLMGESGAGKTTIMRLLTGELRASSGKVEFAGKDISKLKGKHLPLHRRDVAVVFQDYKLIQDRTVFENIALGLEILGKKEEEIKSRVKDLLELVSLQEKEHAFPSQLSGGEMQRVSIARALAMGPKMIFADEPTGNLDWENSVSIARLLDKISQLGTTILMATHNLELVRMLEKRELHLHKGSLLKDTEAIISKVVKQAMHQDHKRSEKDSETHEHEKVQKKGKKHE